jgi:hypothetical protein
MPTLTARDSQTSLVFSQHPACFSPSTETWKSDFYSLIDTMEITVYAYFGKVLQVFSVSRCGCFLGPLEVLTFFVLFTKDEFNFNNRVTCTGPFCTLLCLLRFD